MKFKIVTTQDFLDYFHFSERGSGCGSEIENGTYEKYFFMMTYLPVSFFNLPPNLVLEHKNLIPKKIDIKFELISTGKLNKEKIFIFKPWVLK